MGRPKKMDLTNELPEQSEIELLRQQNAMLLEQIKLLKTKEELDISDGNEVDFRSDEYVKVMSLCSNPLNLNTDPGSKNNINYRFGEFGQVIKIPYRDLNDIVRRNRSFLEAGYFAILNRKAVRSLALDDIYSKILDKEKIDRILTGNESDAVNLFKSTSHRQQENIIRIILNQMLTGIVYDQNLLYRLSQAFDPEYSIMDVFNKLRESKNKS